MKIESQDMENIQIIMFLISLFLLQEDGIVAAVDATKAKTLSERFKVKGFPTGEPFSKTWRYM